MLLTVVAGLVVWSCGSDEKSTDPVSASGDTVPPYVVSTTPSDGDTGIQIDPIIVVTFSEPLDPITLDPDVFTFNGAIGGFSYTSTEIEYHPPQRLLGDSLYSVLIDRSITDTAGNKMTANYSFSFRTTASIRGNYKGTYTGITNYLVPDSVSDTMVQPVFFSFGNVSYSIQIDTLRPIDPLFKMCMGIGSYQLSPDTSFVAGPHVPDTAAGFNDCNPDWNLTGPADTLYQFADGDSLEFIIHDTSGHRLKKLRLGRF